MLRHRARMPSVFGSLFAVGFVVVCCLLFAVGSHLERLFDWLFLPREQFIPDGQLDISELRRLWSAGTDGATADIEIDGEGGWRKKNR